MKWLIYGTGRVVEYFVNAVNKVDANPHFTFKAYGKESDVSSTKKAKNKTIIYNLEKINGRNFDFAYVATPGNLHYENTLELLNKNFKRIIIEKPICKDLKQFMEIKKLANAKGSFIFEGIKTIFNPRHKKVKETISNLGNIVGGEITFSRMATGKKEERFDPKLLKGTFHQHFGYFYSFINDLFVIKDLIHFEYKKNQINDYSFKGIFSTENGEVNFSSDREDDQASSEWQIIFEKGKVIFNNSKWEFAYGNKTILPNCILSNSNNSIGIEYELKEIVLNKNNKIFFDKNNDQSKKILEIYEEYYLK